MRPGSFSKSFTSSSIFLASGFGGPAGTGRVGFVDGLLVSGDAPPFCDARIPPEIRVSTTRPLTSSVSSPSGRFRIFHSAATLSPLLRSIHIMPSDCSGVGPDVSKKRTPRRIHGTPCLGSMAMTIMSTLASRIPGMASAFSVLLHCVPTFVGTLANRGCVALNRRTERFRES